MWRVTDSNSCLLQYPSRSVNANKAAANWERKSKYLLAELVKYQTYVEALRTARTDRLKRKDEKQVKRLLERADEDDDGEGVDHLYSPASISSPRFATVRLATPRIEQDGSGTREDAMRKLENKTSLEKEDRRKSGGTVSTTGDVYTAEG